MAHLIGGRGSTKVRPAFPSTIDTRQQNINLVVVDSRQPDRAVTCSTPIPEAPMKTTLLTETHPLSDGPGVLDRVADHHIHRRAILVPDSHA